MSSYQRLISYIYAYEGGIKGKNIGFAKLETRGTQCRIMVSVKKIFVGGNPIGVYLLAGEEEIRIGTLFARGGAGEFRTVVNARNVENSGRSMEECCGLSVHDTESAWRSYTTIWEDAVAHAAEVELADVTSEAMQEKERQKEAEKIRSAEDNVTEETEKPADEKCDAGAPEDEDPEEEASGPADDGLPISSEIEREMEKEELEKLGILRIRDRLDRGCPGAEESVDREQEAAPEEPENTAQLRDTDEGEITEEIQSSECAREQVRETELPAGSIRSQLFRTAPAEQGKEDVRVSGQEAVPAPSSAIPAPRREKGSLEKEKELWENMRKRYPKILAFDYADGCEILAIKPQDIGLLPRENWIYGNNSFLLHGYYNYRYLILARLNQPDGGGRYLLGVPGHYQSNEKYMAAMFGFSDFVLSKKQPPRDSRFGYWYTDIRVAP